MMAATDLCRNKHAQVSTLFLSLAGRLAYQTGMSLTMFAVQSLTDVARRRAAE